MRTPRGLSSDQAALYRAGRDVLDSAQDVLSVPAIRNEIGREKANRMQQIAQNAGMILVHNSKVTVIPPRRTLRTQPKMLFIPLHPGIAEDGVVTLPVNGKIHPIPVGSLAKRGNPNHISIDGVHGTSLMTWPIEARLTYAEKAGAAVHELIHADQRYTPRSYYPSGERLRWRASNEAEAYNGQFAVLDHSVGGALSGVVDNNRRNGDAHTLYLPSDLPDDVDAMIHSSVPTQKALIAVTRSAVHGHIADGSVLTSQQLASEYQQHGLIHDADLQS